MYQFQEIRLALGILSGRINEDNWKHNSNYLKFFDTHGIFNFSDLRVWAEDTIYQAFRDTGILDIE